ncbi:MAG: FHA domain-containing protein, partial [Acidimicrobiales bacterium]|nr:FHA domain-containing protein [Acidimicrobiales bacterium]
VYTVATDYIIGREPSDDPAVARGATGLAIDDADRTVSRVHAELRIEGWDLYVLDRGSSNGTFLLHPHETSRERVGPEPMYVPPGAMLQLGQRTLSFEPYHQTPAARL